MFLLPAPVCVDWLPTVQCACCVIIPRHRNCLTLLRSGHWRQDSCYWWGPVRPGRTEAFLIQRPCRLFPVDGFVHVLSSNHCCFIWWFWFYQQQSEGALFAEGGRGLSVLLMCSSSCCRLGFLCSCFLLYHVAAAGEMLSSRQHCRFFCWLCCSLPC